jgi:uncharacterized protein (TIGR00369 family)
VYFSLLVVVKQFNFVSILLIGNKLLYFRLIGINTYENLLKFMVQNKKYSADYFNSFGKEFLPGHLGIIVIDIKENYLSSQLNIRPIHFAPNGYVHAGTIVSLADTSAGYACLAHLPENGISFTTIELKSNFLSSARQGTVFCEAIPLHLGKTTHLWDVKVKHLESDKLMALFRCTQLIIYSK